MIELERQGDVFVLTMTDGENRWNTTLCRELDAALDEVIASEGPAALVTASADTKFFSNGLDLGWITSRGEHPGGDRKAFNNEAMAVLAKMLTLPVPTVCAVNGHAFGAGLMLALGHDVRVMREDRGYLCANEIQLGFAIPAPELALFRSKMSMGAFHQTVQLAKRWSAAEALAEERPWPSVRELMSDELTVFDDGVGAKEREEVGLGMCVTARRNGLCVKRRAAAGSALVEEQDPELLAGPAEPARRVIGARRREARTALQEDEPWEVRLVFGGEDDLAREDGDRLACRVSMV